MHSNRTCTAVAFLALTMTSAPATAQTISTYNPLNTTLGWTAVGPGWLTQVGQVFTSPGTQITSMSFWIGGSIGSNWVNDGLQGSGVVVRPNIMAWTGTAATGSLLFQGDAVTVQGLTEYTRYDFTTGSTALTPGQTYVAFLEAVNDGTHLGNVLLLQGNNPGTSGAVGTNINGATNPLTSTWMLGPSTTRYDGAFEATFEGGEQQGGEEPSATPEPGSLVLMATGLGMLISVRRARKRTGRITDVISTTEL